MQQTSVLQRRKHSYTSTSGPASENTTVDNLFGSTEEHPVSRKRLRALIQKPVDSKFGPYSTKHCMKNPGPTAEETRKNTQCSLAPATENTTRTETTIRFALQQKLCIDDRSRPRIRKHHFFCCGLPLSSNYLRNFQDALFLHGRDTGDKQPPLGVHGDADVVVRVQQNGAFVIAQAGVEGGERRQGHRCGLSSLHPRKQER